MVAPQRHAAVPLAVRHSPICAWALVLNWVATCSVATGFVLTGCVAATSADDKAPSTRSSESTSTAQPDAQDAQGTSRSGGQGDASAAVTELPAEGGARPTLPSIDDDVPEVSEHNGQTGSIGSVECSSDTECVDIEQARLDSLGVTQSDDASFANGECIQAGIAGGPSGIACECSNAGGGSLLVGLDCARLGRHGECIFAADEFAGCELGTATACNATCNDLQQRLHEAAQVTYETELRSAVCSAGSCKTVARVADVCHVNGDYLRPFDCSQSDAEILATASAAAANMEAGPCSTLNSNTTGTCAEPTPEAAQYFPRPADEWQGMLVDITSPLYCEGFCGLALACIDGQCLPCQADDECLEGEGCALDHCVLLENIECKSHAECPGEALCILSGYTGGTARANEDMRAYCLGASGGGKAMSAQR